MALIIPEIIIQDTVEIILDAIIFDWNFYTDKTNTILYKNWHDESGNPIIQGTYNYYTEAQSVFLKTEADKRKLKITSYYPKDKKEFPVMVLNVPAESNGAVDALGFNFNSSDVSFGSDTYTNNTARSFDGTYSLLIISDNANEAKLIYHTIRAALITESILNHLTFSGFQNLSISGRELQKFDTDLVPFHYIRAINIKGFTEQVVDDFIASAMANGLTFGGLASDTLSLDGGTITGIESFSYDGGLGSDIIGISWTDNSDATGNSNPSDSVVVTFFNYNKSQWIYPYNDPQRSSETLQVSIPTEYTWEEGDIISVTLKVIRGTKESETSELLISFLP